MLDSVQRQLYLSFGNLANPILLTDIAIRAFVRGVNQKMTLYSKGTSLLNKVASPELKILHKS